MAAFERMEEKVESPALPLLPDTGKAATTPQQTQLDDECPPCAAP